MLSISGAIILITCLCLANSAALFDDSKSAMPFAEENYRLPLTIVPVNYNILFKPYLNASDPKAFTFDAVIYIEIIANQSTSEISMHSKNLNYTTRQLWKKDQPTAITSLNATAIPNSLTDIITYTLSTPMIANQSYILHFVYTGSMDDDMRGFYRSSYTDKKNSTKWLGSTQFEINHARRAFPSFDEPKFKATFNVALVRHKSMKTASNARIESSTTEGEYITDVYASTPKMSTYLLAFIVSEFNERFNGDFGIIARPEYYAQTEYSYDVGQEILTELDNYLGIKYYEMGIDKMHMAAIPDFAPGAMENWGLLTYRENALLYDKEVTSLNSKQYIASVIAHEQAHMWFGDLVTCDWWSYAWLNEGFASYFEYFATNKVETEFKMDQQFVVDLIQSVMAMDSTNNTNPMSDKNTNTPADLSRMFNSITYFKGASIIRMIKHVMGEENFQKSLNEYLTTHKHTNTIPSDLFTIWEKYWPTNFASYADSLFATFTTQVGYPVVTFNLTSPTTLVISQKRFLLKDNDGSNPNLFYTVPITYTTSGEKSFNATTPKLFITNTAAAHTVTLPSTTTWIVGNIQETGYYRVNYDISSWHKIHHLLFESNWGGIHELNRAQVVDDLLNLARASVIEYDLALQILEYLETETNYLPWTSAFNGYNYLAIRLGTDMGNFGHYIRKLTQKSYNWLGFEEKSSDSTLDIYNRGKILSWSCKFGNEECIKKAKEYFNKDLKTNPVPVNIRSVVYCTAMREGTEQYFNKLFNKYKAETVATEETLILNSLGCVKDSTLVTKYFDIIISDNIRRQDKSSALSALYSENNENVELVFDLVEKKLDQLATSMGGYSAVATIISNIATRFTTKAQETKLKNFNTNNKSKFGSSASTLEAAEKTVAENLLWDERKLGTFKTYLEKLGKSGSASISSYTAFTWVLVVLISKAFHKLALS